MYVSSRVRNHILEQQKLGKVLLYMKLNTRITLTSFWYFIVSAWTLNFYLASISFATLSMYFVDWFNFAIVPAFIRNLRVEQYCVLLVNKCLYIDSRLNLCFMLILIASVRWEIRQNLTMFFVSFPVKGTWEGVFFIKVAGYFLPTAILPKMNFFCRFFFRLC